MAHVEQRVYEHFKQYEQTHFTSPPAYTTIAATAPRAILLDDATLTAGPAFAKVTGVVSGSPADQAGLEVGDAIKNFAGVNWTNHENLSKIAQVVQKNEGVSGPGVCLAGDCGNSMIQNRLTWYSVS